jgi:hypothetical protein
MVALVIIYNHKFEKNIDKLEEIYKEKFSHIFHIMPFYTGKKENIITIYDHSYYFQGYVAQAYQNLKHRGNFDHFMFIADDMILHPELNEDTYENFLQLDKETSFITNIHDLETQGNSKYPLFFLHQALFFKLPQQGSGLEILNDLPTYNEAIELFKKKGFDEPYFLAEHVYSLPKRTDFASHPLGTYKYRKRKKEVQNILNQKKIKPNYPLVCGYSDFFVISNKNMDKFALYCGIFAACRLFVDYAMTTSMLLSCDKIKTEKDLNRKGYVMTGDGGPDHPLYENQPEFEQKYNFSLDKLLTNFPNNAIFVHPIKLSKWK